MSFFYLSFVTGGGGGGGGGGGVFVWFGFILCVLSVSDM